MVKTENAAEVGMHVFERAGLGVAPFRFMGMSEKVMRHPDGTMQPSGSCQYCGMGLRYVCAVEGRDGRRFNVGSDCVAKTGDAGLLKAYKTSPSVRKLNAAKAKAKADRVVAEWTELLADAGNRARLEAVTVEPFPGKVVTLLASYERVWGMCGAAGRARYLKALKARLAELAA